MLSRFLGFFFLLPTVAVAKTFYFCTVEVDNPFPIQHGFINYYLTQKVEETLLETGWVQDCSKGKTIRVKVKNLNYRGSSISGNRYGGYTFSIRFSISLPDKTFNYSMSRYVPLPDPSLGTYPIREAFADLMDSYQIRIKRDLLYYMKSEEEKLTSKGSK
jgi:hypothetical protein